MPQVHPPRSHAIHSRVRSFSRAGGRLTDAQARALDLPFITEVVLAEIAALAVQDGPLTMPETVPFFDNRTPQPRFARIA